MESKTYSKFSGLNHAIDPLDVNQVTFLQLENVIINRKLGQGLKRAGTYHWSVTGNIWGIGAYNKETSSPKLPPYDLPLRHRRDGSTSYIEKLDWSAYTWSALTQGAQISGNLGISDICSFAQIGPVLCICAGRPAKLVSESGTVERLGGPAPTAAPTVGNSGTGLTGSYSFVYTFYDSTTGWESSPSPASSVVTITNKQLDLSALETSCAREGVDKKRIYRTIRTGEAPYLYDGEVALATTTYSTTVADDSLGTPAPDDGDHDLPPTSSYLVAAHENRLWISDGSRNLWYSKPYDGNAYNLEYFSEDRKLTFPARVTGLVTTRAAGLQVFTPPSFGIFEVEGTGDTSYSVRKAFDDLGTNFHTSICSHDGFVAFWGESGPCIISPDGIVKDFVKPIENILRPVLVEEFGTEIFVWTVWSDEKQQFLFGFSASDPTYAQWEERDTGIVVPWVDVDTGAIIPWIDNP